MGLVGATASRKIQAELDCPPAPYRRRSPASLMQHRYPVALSPGDPEPVPRAVRSYPHIHLTAPLYYRCALTRSQFREHYQQGTF